MNETKTQKPKMICKKTIKETYGWTDSMIKQLLPEPILRTNPRYACAPKMCLWPEEDVKKVMQSEAFANARVKSLKRRQAAKATAAKKSERLHMEKNAMAEHLINDIYVEHCNLEYVRKYALEAQQEYYLEKGDYTHDAYSCTDQRVIDRWTVNYIRHSLSNYHELMDEYCQVYPQTDTEYLLKIKEAVLTKIAEEYPDLVDACFDQIVRSNQIESLRDMGF